MYIYTYVLFPNAGLSRKTNRDLLPTLAELCSNICCEEISKTAFAIYNKSPVSYLSFSSTISFLIIQHSSGAALPSIFEVENFYMCQSSISN